MPVRARELRLSTPGLTLAARLWENPHAAPSAVPVIAVHGFQDNAASFDRLAPALLQGGAQAPCRAVLALDLAGHGHSAWRAPGVGYFIMDYAADVLSAANALAWREFVILGHSLGAGIATLLGGAASERVLSALLIDGLGPVSMDPVKAPALAARAFAERAAPRPRQRLMEDLEVAATVRASSRISIGHEAARSLCARGTRASGEGLCWRADPRLSRTSLSRLTEDTVLAFIGAMELPTLLIEAEQGVLHHLPPGRYAARLAAHPRLTKHRLPGRHHLHMEDAAEPIAELANAFLRAHLAPGSG